MIRTHRLVLATILLFALAACGGGGGGGGGQMSTLSGNVSNQSAAMRMESAPTMLASLLRLLSPVTDAVAGRSGIHVSVNGLETDTDQNGFFAITGPFSGLVTVTFGNGNKTFTLEVNVPPGATVVLRDVQLKENGKAEPSGRDFSLRGTVAGANCGGSPQTLVVGLGSQSVTVELDGSTRIHTPGKGQNGSCADLANSGGQPVHVDGEQLPDGSLVADNVKVTPGEGEEEDEDEVKFHGTVTALDCPGSITVERSDGELVVVNLTSSTEIDGASGCEDLAGQDVKVEGIRENGAVVAKEIEVKNGHEDDEGENDHGNGQGNGQGHGDDPGENEH